MKKIALLFPGQGSQYKGMGKNLDVHYFKEADLALGYSLSQICFEGSDEELKLTQNTQPAIVTHSYALYKKFEPLIKKGEVIAVLGHSVGEYSALLAAGSLSFSDAVKAVHHR